MYAVEYDGFDITRVILTSEDGAEVSRWTYHYDAPGGRLLWSRAISTWDTAARVTHVLWNDDGSVLATVVDYGDDGELDFATRYYFDDALGVECIDHPEPTMDGYIARDCLDSGFKDIYRYDEDGRYLLAYLSPWGASSNEIFEVFTYECER